MARVQIGASLYTLKDFIRKAQTISLYRKMLKTCRPCLDLNLRNEIESQIKTEFRRNKNAADPFQIKSLMQEGFQSLKRIEDLCNSKSGVKDKTENPEKPVGEGWPWMS